MKKVFAILMAAMLLMGACAMAQAEATMTVQGTGIVMVDANRATVSLGVREIAPDVMTAQSIVNEKIDALIAALKEADVPADAIETSSLGIYPNYDYDEVERINGYVANNSINFTVSDVENVGAYIDAAFSAGANSLDYVEFSAADTDEAADKALALAVESAAHKAETLAQAAGVKLGGIVEIRDNTNVGFDMSDSFSRTEASSDKGAGTQVLPSRQQVGATVYITYAITAE